MLRSRPEPGRDQTKVDHGVAQAIVGILAIGVLLRGFLVPPLGESFQLDPESSAWPMRA
jgi:hypothetical protein